MCQVAVVGLVIILLYTSRACYNLVAITLTSYNHVKMFDYDWYNVSDQVSAAFLQFFLFPPPQNYTGEKEIFTTHLDPNEICTKDSDHLYFQTFFSQPCSYFPFRYVYNTIENYHSPISTFHSVTIQYKRMSPLSITLSL